MLDKMHDLPRGQNLTWGPARTPSGSPPAEIDVDEPLVRSLLAGQHPDLSHLPLEHIDEGWDNTLWRLGDELLVRLPRRAQAASLVAKEQRWLPSLAPLLPLPVPAPLRAGLPSVDYPWRWSIVPWLSGCPGDRATISDPDDAARRLGHFLRALHQPAPRDAPLNPYRGVPLADRSSTFEDRLVELASEIDVAATRRVWDRACQAPPWHHPSTWLHGDLHPANTLVSQGTLVGIVDFGDLGAGDPATDLAAALMLLPRSSDATFEDAYGEMGPDLEARSLGWALLFGMMLLSIGLDTQPSSGHPTYAPIGRSTLMRVAERHAESP
jgi:aminoglycoside phosphotransferase (APT) family kinase protein